MPIHALCFVYKYLNDDYIKENYGKIFINLSNVCMLKLKIKMGLDNLSKYTITLRRCEEDLIIKTCDISEDVPTTTYRFQLSSLFTLLEDGKLTNIQPSWTKITSLDLSHCDLLELPKCIKFLHLKNFNISHNKFSQVPSCLYGNGLRDLESLDISYNKLSHFDIEPDCVLNVKQLKLNNNSFENVPKWFLTFRCTNLEEFNYSENNAKHYDFLKNSWNLNFMKLRKLELKNSCLLDKDMPWIKCFKTLKYLDISNKSLVNDTKYINKVKELDILFIKPCWKTMEILILNFLDISFFPEGIFWIKSLKELHITNNLISWLPDGLEYLVNLELLNISNNQLVFIPKQISQLAKLKFLFASKNQLEEVPAMPDNLEVLDLYDNYLEIIDMGFLEHIREHISRFDLELNFIDLEVGLNICYKMYSSKRDMFRDSYNIIDRSNGFKSRGTFNSSSSSEISSDSDTEYWNNMNNSDDKSICQNRIDTPDEDWDREIMKTPVFRHPDISLSDHEYEGEKEMCFQQNFIKKPRVYIDNEDLIFIDAD